jgi:hypothetical protein
MGEFSSEIINPIEAFSSSTVPYASSLGSHFFILPPLASEVSP